MYVCRDSGSPIDAAVEEYFQSEEKYRVDVSLALEKALLGRNGYPSLFSLEDSMEPILKYYDERHHEFLETARSCWRKAAVVLQQVVDSTDSVKSLLDVHMMDIYFSDDDRSTMREWCEQLQITQSMKYNKL